MNRAHLMLTVVISSLVLPNAAIAGKFSTWTGAKVQVSVDVPDPPEAYIGKKTAKIEVQGAVPEIGGDHFRMLLEQALAPDLGIDNNKAEAIIRVTFVSYARPEMKNYALNENMYVKTGEKTVYNKKGEGHQEDVYGNRVLPVQYWEGSGSLSLHVETRAADGAMLDIFDPKANFSQKLRISINGEATPEARQGTPDQNQILGSLTQDVVAAIRKRYVLTNRRETIMLAIDDELKSGNELAKGGHWAEALKAWEAAQVKKNSSDRIYNMAAAYEVVAYDTYRQTQDMAEASVSFSKALDMYAQAQQGDPGEKYIRLASARIARAKDSMDRAMKQYQAQQFAIQKQQQELAASQQDENAINDAANVSGSGGKALSEKDAPTEAKFRLFVRTRLAALRSEPDRGGIDNLVSDGQQRYAVDPDRGRRIALQEIGKRRLREKGRKAYREDFSLYAKDGIITADERSLLRDTAAQYELETSDVSEIEAGFHVREPGKVAVAKRPTASTVLKRATEAMPEKSDPSKP